MLSMEKQEPEWNKNWGNLKEEEGKHDSVSRTESNETSPKVEFPKVGWHTESGQSTRKHGTPSILKDLVTRDKDPILKERQSNGYSLNGHQMQLQPLIENTKL
ncbi:hypothetical protein V6N12_004071 [Hibiscus sabdariffa]|uniref:Uncharacterized protein n=1 Tax=Hibiscus sabdariffa TaxID=183260 RepID=A0ABR2CKD6_9ROSI